MDVPKSLSPFFNHFISIWALLKTLVQSTYPWIQLQIQLLDSKFRITWFFIKRFSQKQAKDDEIAKLNWTHTRSGKYCSRLNLMFHWAKKKNFWHELMHVFQYDLHNDYVSYSQTKFKPKFNSSSKNHKGLVSFGMGMWMWESLKMGNKFKGISHCWNSWFNP